MAVAWPVRTMIARPAAAIPDGERWSYEPKFDGFHCTAVRQADGRVQLRSRQQRVLTPSFPDVVEAVATRLPVGTVVDGEVVVMAERRVDFRALQRRLTSRRVERGAPATFVVFDLLAYRDEDLRPLPYEERRHRLEEAVEASSAGLALMPATREYVGAQAWMHHADDGVEGVVAKRCDHGYYPRLRYWSKIRTKSSCEAVIGGVVGSPQAPVALILGRYDDGGRLRVVGRTFPLRREVRHELATMLAPPSGPHPWPTMLAGGRFGLPGSKAVAHTPVAPTVVVEVEADSCYEADRYRHGVRFVRARPDLCPHDITQR